MTAHEKTGGTAFPMPANEYAGHGPEWGMTLRDYFAAKALSGLLADHVQRIAGGEESPIGFAQAARMAYGYADAMLAARNEE